MRINWILIGCVLAFGIVLVAFLAWRNRKDEQEVEQYFNHQDSFDDKDEEEANDV